MRKEYGQVFTKAVCGILCTFGMTLGLGSTVFAQTDADTDNSASFSTDVIYQIVTDRFVDGDSSNNPTGDIFDTSDLKKYHGGDWAGITEKIEDGYFTNMGVTALWISSPVENIMTLDPTNQCASYHGYWAKDFFETNEAFGTEEDFTTLVNTAHENGIKIVIDFAPNHTSTAEFSGYTFPEDGALYRNGSLIGTFSNDYAGIFNHESWTDYSTYENGIYHSMYGLADLNQQNATVDSYLKEAIDQWLDYGVDGIRVDAVKHMSMGWQTNWLSSIYEEHSVFIFGEWYNGGTGNDSQMTTFANESGMSLLDFRYANAVRNALGSGSGTMEDLYQVMVDTASDYEEVNDQVTFIDNHDMSRFMTLADNNARDVENAYVLLLTSRGVPTIYYGSEQYAQGSTDPYNRGDMTSFNENSTAYKVISALAPLRKSNPAAAYGTTQERWMNDDVLIYEREFNGSVILTAVNRNQNQSYSISGLYTDLPAGTYSDVMNGLLGGNGITVNSNGAVTNFTLGAGASAVWQFTKTDSTEVTIGNVDPGMGIAGNEVTITGRGFGDSTGSVTFGDTAATVKDWSDSRITIEVPSVAAGEYAVTVTNAAGSSSDSYAGFDVLTGKQVSVRFMVNNAETAYGTNVYLVGSVPELGSWDTSKAIGSFFNSTSSIASYPTWFYDVSVPAGTTIEYKFVKIDGSGNVTWESGSNHVVTTPSEGTATVQVNWQ
ncbi:MAG: alpha-amylase family glycosyl hydrolase [Roseburia sp.]